MPVLPFNRDAQVRGRELGGFLLGAGSHGSSASHDLDDIDAPLSVLANGVSYGVGTQLGFRRRGSGSARRAW